MIYVLLGATCSGKTTALKQLMERDYRTIISFTTRPKRTNEIDGKDYFFVNKSMFHKLEQSGSLVSVNSFTNAQGVEWFYGIHRIDIDLNEDSVVITEPKGYRDLVENLGKENVQGIYLNTSYEIRLLRGLNRNDHAAELLRRLESDKIDFENFENEVEHVVVGKEKKEILDSIISIINGGSQNE